MYLSTTTDLTCQRSWQEILVPEWTPLDPLHGPTIRRALSHRPKSPRKRGILKGPASSRNLWNQEHPCIRRQLFAPQEVASYAQIPLTSYHEEKDPDAATHQPRVSFAEWSMVIEPEPTAWDVTDQQEEEKPLLDDDLWYQRSDYVQFRNASQQVWEHAVHCYSSATTRRRDATSFMDDKESSPLDSLRGIEPVISRREFTQRKAAVRQSLRAVLQRQEILIQQQRDQAAIQARCRSRQRQRARANSSDKMASSSLRSPCISPSSSDTNTSSCSTTAAAATSSCRPPQQQEEEPWEEQLARVSWAHSQTSLVMAQTRAQQDAQQANASLTAQAAWEYQQFLVFFRHAPHEPTADTRSSRQPTLLSKNKPYTWKQYGHQI
uniref:Uncharacterized protein n=1 Tax=Entomoneis paludosa TaxID=265537 RepID=A0A7S2YMV0_9STRA|mmetsp:Transcript_39112/g.81192  ORF Transcript_39112/g.81192 Transcript_39112/m.81192 type:complete len:379 (+) Transcript_39112:221-1357(+)